MKITYTDGRVTVVGREDEAREILLDEYPDAFFLDEYQSIGRNLNREEKAVDALITGALHKWSRNT